MVFIGEVNTVGRCLGAAVAHIKNNAIRGVEGAAPYGAIV